MLEIMISGVVARFVVTSPLVAPNVTNRMELAYNVQEITLIQHCKLARYVYASIIVLLLMEDPAKSAMCLYLIV